jgi:hypothetical protein
MKLNKATLAAFGAMTVLAAGAAPAMAEENAAEAAAAAVSFQPAEAKKGSMIYSDGKRIGQVIRVRENGDAQIVINGKAHLVPAETLYEENGKLVTSLSRAEVVANKG